MSRFLWGIALASALAVTVYQTGSQVDIAGRSVKTAYTRWAFNFWFNPHLFRLKRVLPELAQPTDIKGWPRA